jgi:hypothetical protein
MAANPNAATRVTARGARRAAAASRIRRALARRFGQFGSSETAIAMAAASSTER